MKLVIASNGLPYLQMRTVGSHSASGREQKGTHGEGVIEKYQIREEKRPIEICFIIVPYRTVYTALYVLHKSAYVC